MIGLFYLMRRFALSFFALFRFLSCMYFLHLNPICIPFYNAIGGNVLRAGLFPFKSLRA